MLRYDHFDDRLHWLWASFHHMWIASVSRACNRAVPKPFFVLPGIHIGFEVDVAAMDRLEHDPKTKGWKSGWNPPFSDGDAKITIDEDEMEILVHNREGTDFQVVGAIEFVSPANKDRPETRDAFVSKVHSFLLKGIGVVIVDIVTEKKGNLHNDLMNRLGAGSLTMDADIYATSYRVTGSKGVGSLKTWRRALQIGKEIPTMPLWLFGGICIPVPLDEAYEEACENIRIADFAAVKSPARVPVPA